MPVAFCRVSLCACGPSNTQVCIEHIKFVNYNARCRSALLAGQDAPITAEDSCSVGLAYDLKPGGDRNVHGRMLSDTNGSTLRKELAD